MKKLLGFTCLIVLLAVSTLSAEEWNLGADFSLNLTQNSYSDNWAGDEKSSISWTAVGNFNGEKQLHDKMHWSNKLQLFYGQTHIQDVDDAGDKYWKKPEESTDKVDFESIMRFTLETYIDPYVSGRLETQFTDAEDNMFNPKTLTEAAGIARQFIKNDNTELMSRLGFAFRQTINKDTDNTNDGGVEFITDFNHDFNERMSYTTTLRVFKAVFYSESDNVDNDDWKAPDMDWEHTLSMSVVKYLSVKMYMQLLYDKQIDTDVRFKETLGLGFTYKLM
jgi:hypothetical protein